MVVSVNRPILRRCALSLGHARPNKHEKKLGSSDVQTNYTVWKTCLLLQRERYTRMLVVRAGLPPLHNYIYITTD